MSRQIRAIMLMITLAAVYVGKGHAQQQGNNNNQGNNIGGSACLNQLMPCVNYLNNQGGQRGPPDSCCDPLKSVIKSNPECLCSMLSNQGTITAQLAGINATQAQELPARCGQRVNPIACLTTTSKNTPGSSDSHILRNSKIYLLFPLMIIAALYS